ncbi:electron transport complex subunit RsxD [Flocculibacter collagenilyticus]|uniref:electron transport complex subunit RsxD n=1 Tax=Flocculibacter collagenilyticus TaxID=2744479 RepID=UPI0018F6CFD1|nr:electron transport complex subunit RsxD [Flocculibacter collagenilyticus]
MSFTLASSPHNHKRKTTSQLMLLVIYACIPAAIVQAYFFGWGNLIHIAIASFTAIAAEAVFLAIRNKAITPRLTDYSAILTGVLIGLSVPSFAPWWISFLGAAFAIIIVKQLYGGIGFNLFNPAMAAYVMLLISFPLQMTSWLPPVSLMQYELTIVDAFYAIFTGFSSAGYSIEQLRLGVDGITMATPLDTLKTDLTIGMTTTESMASPVFSLDSGLGLSGLGWEWINLAFFAGGMFLIFTKTINWHIPAGFLSGLFGCALIGFLISPDTVASPTFHIFSGAAMFGAFFIATDPVSASTTNKGRVIFGLLIGCLIYFIRVFGGYPDAIAFAVLLANMCVPLIDYYTRPTTYGHVKEVSK